MPECAPTTTTTGQLDLEALGDFDPSAQTHVVVGVAAPDSTLGIPDSTRALSLTADTAQGFFRGIALMPDSGDVPVSLWPAGRACALYGVRDDRGYPPDLDGVAIGYSPSASVALVVGGSSAPTSALVVDLARGTAAPVDPAFGPRTPRIGATVTAFGPKLLVAGGSDSDSAANASADVFDPATGHFEQARIELERSRANHAAVVLASGATLLVGGSNGESQVLKQLEIVSPETRAYSVSQLEILKTGRSKPRAIRLTDDRILVGGGFGADGVPIDTLEWLSPDATFREPQSPSLASAGAAPVADRAFVAMPGGSALAVGGCQLASVGGCVPCSTSAGTGCAIAEVLWIGRDASVELLPDALDVATFPVLLVDGAEGRPWLVASSPNGRRLLRFDPWLGRFASPESDAPPQPLAGFELADTADDSGFEARVIGADPGLMMWMTGSATALPQVFGFRHGARNPYDAAVAPLLLTSQDGVALDRMSSTAASGLPGVELADGGDTLVVTDTTYADLDLTIEIVEGQPPIVVLFARGDAVEGENTYGGESCPWPAPPVDGASAPRLRRVGEEVTLTLGAEQARCKGPNGRVSIWLRNAGGKLRIRSIDVKRSP